jgi:replicative DNA helicase
MTLVRDDGPATPPPYDLDAEAAVLSAVLIDPSALAKVDGVVRAEHFYSEAHRRIFEAVLEVRDRGGVVDTTTVASRLKATKRIHQVGGIEYIVDVINASPAFSNVRPHAVIVAERWRLRRIIATCQRAAAEGYGAMDDVQEFVTRYAAALGELARLRPGGKRVDNIDLLMGVLKQLQAAAHAPVEPGKRKGIMTGLEAYDRHTLGLHAGQKTTIAALPGRGKTSLALQIGVNVASSGIGVAFFCTEQTALELADKQLALLASVDSKRIAQARQSATLTAEEWQRLTKAVDSMEHLRTGLMIDDDPNITVEDVCARSKLLAEEANARGAPLGLIIVDHLHRLRRSAHLKTTNRIEELAHATRTLAILAKELKLPVLEFAQERKPDKDRAGKSGRPTLGCVAWCSVVEQESHNVAYLWRPSDQDRRATKLLLVKHRSGGDEAEFDLTFEREFSRFVDTPTEDFLMTCPSRQYVPTSSGFFAVDD